MNDSIEFYADYYFGFIVEYDACMMLCPGGLCSRASLEKYLYESLIILAVTSNKNVAEH